MFPVFYRAMLYAAHTRRGRRLLFLGALHAFRLARSPRARRAYAGAWTIAANPRSRKAAGKAVRSAARRVKR